MLLCRWAAVCRRCSRDRCSGGVLVAASGLLRLYPIHCPMQQSALLTSSPRRGIGTVFCSGSQTCPISRFGSHVQRHPVDTAPTRAHVRERSIKMAILQRSVRGVPGSSVKQAQRKRRCRERLPDNAASLMSGNRVQTLSLSRHPPLPLAGVAFCSPLPIGWRSRLGRRVFLSCIRLPTFTQASNG